MKRALLVAILLAVTTVSAWSYFFDTYGGQPVRWPNARATVYHDANSITGAYVTELKAALAVWSSVPGSAFVFTHGGASPSANVKDSNNGVTDVYFDPSLPPFGYAVTMVNMPYTSADITERDIAFNGNITWTTNATNQAGGPPDFRTVAIHELGHVLGLRHPTEASPPQNVQSVMNTSADPAFAQHSLFKDDMDAMVALYPGSGGPGPGPGPQVSDLVVDSVSYTPADAGPGDDVDVSYTVRNAGANPTAAFVVFATVTGTVHPRPTEPFVGSDSELPLDPGESRSGTIDGRIPAGLSPGHYRIGIFADADQEVAESNESNNGNASLATFRVDRPPIVVGPGQQVVGGLGPLGEDLFSMDLAAGTKLKLKCSTDTGLLKLDVTRDGVAGTLAKSGPGRKLKSKVEIPADGGYTLRLETTFAGQSIYEVSIGAKTMKTKSSGSIDAQIRVPFRVYRGSKVTALVKGKKGFKPDAGVENFDAPVKLGKTKAKVGPFEADRNGEMVLLVRPADGAPGEAVWTIKVKPAKKAVTLSR